MHFSTGISDFTFLHSVEIRYEANLASYSVGTGGALAGGKLLGCDSDHLAPF
jgi:hypothetical protein